MYKKRNTLLIIAAIIIVGCLLYIPGVMGLGFYRDAWNYFYNLKVRGPEMLIQAFNADRPADGYLIAGLYNLFGTNIKAYLIYDLIARILSSIFFSFTLLTVWPRRPKMAGLAGLLAVAFPGFLQQVDAITYLPHQTAMLSFMISLLLTVQAVKCRQRGLKILLTVFSMPFSFVYVMLMEYYVGMEIFRFGLIYVMGIKHPERGKLKYFWKSILLYIPYLLPIGGFLVWRLVFFKATRAGTDFVSEIVKPFLIHPKHEIADLGVRMIKNVWKLFAGPWTIPVHSLTNGLDMKVFVKTLIPSVVIFIIAIFFLFLIGHGKSDESYAENRAECFQALWYGLICGTVAILPLVISGRDINYSSSLDRFAWPGMIGTILFMVGLFGVLGDCILSNLLIMISIITAVFVQLQNQNVYIDLWKETKDYWQQMIWRVPSLEPGTTIVSSAKILTEEDYEIFCPASMIYYPYVNSWAPVSAEILSGNTVRDIQMGEKVYRKVREIYTEKDYQQLLAVSKPDANSCLRIIDGNNPIYSSRDWSKIPEIGAYSKTGQIILEPEEKSVYPYFLPEELDHNWCYYFEKMELALQMNDPETAAGLADEAAEKKFSAGDPVEMIPVIEAYVQTGRGDDALPFVELMQKDNFLNFEAIKYFEAKNDSGLYNEVISAFKGDDPDEMETENADMTSEENPESDSAGK